MRPVTVRNIKIGEGRPKICVPIVEKEKEGILAQASAIAGLPLDMAEWRADWYEDVKDSGKVLDTVRELRKVLGEIPLLFTFRTAAEGGAADMAAAAYAELCAAAARSGYADLIDVEVFTAGESAQDIVREVHRAGVNVVASNHDFHKTPPKEELLRRFRHMKALGADIWKIAVMPQSGRDVLTLLDATLTVTEAEDSSPVISMSMTALGAVSRLSGEVFGSSVTFAAAGKASAPGQISVDKMSEMLDILRL